MLVIKKDPIVDKYMPKFDFYGLKDSTVKDVEFAHTNVLQIQSKW